MFDRVQYKKNAKLQLKGQWGIPILITAISFGVSIILSAPAFLSKMLDIFQTENTGNGVSIIVSGSADFLSVLNWLAIGIFSVAQIHVYLIMSGSSIKITFNNFLDGLTLWIRAILSSLWYTLWVAIWLCLFIVPGLIKMISYSMMFFLVAEYPKLSIRKAMRISKVLTKGYKADLFVMGLSFLGWEILASLSCGIGMLWLVPYSLLSYTNAYRSLKQMALSSGVLSIQDLQ